MGKRFACQKATFVHILQKAFYAIVRYNGRRMRFRKRPFFIAARLFIFAVFPGFCVSGTFFAGGKNGVIKYDMPPGIQTAKNIKTAGEISLPPACAAVHLYMYSTTYRAGLCRLYVYMNIARHIKKQNRSACSACLKVQKKRNEAVSFLFCIHYSTESGFFRGAFTALTVSDSSKSRKNTLFTELPL